ncbi:MAG: carboxypeptidase-like regulatory domain-containing protein [Pseudomonadota bacterium]
MSPSKPNTLGAVASFAAAFAAFGLSVPAAAQPDAVTSPAGTSTWQANDDDFLFLQLVIESYKLTYDVRGYQTDRGVCLDLADVIQSLDLPIRIDKKSRRATGWLFAEDQKFTLDRDANTVQNVNTGRAPVASDLYDTPEGWCVDVKALSNWFGIEFRPDLYNAVVRLESNKDLPFMQAIERRSRAARLKSRKPKSFDLSKFPSADMEYKPWRTPSLDVVARAGHRTGGTGANGTTGRVELYAAGEALGASYFARLATDDELSPQTLRMRAYRNDPEGNLLGPLKATQIAVGDVETLSGRLTNQTSVGRGAFISNRPLGRSANFSTTDLRGVLPAGWDAELYRNGQLIGFQEDDGDGRYEFLNVELFFGRNELEVVLYGPQGQVRREKTDFPVGFNQIEPGETYYWAGILQDDRDLIEINPDNVTSPQKWRWGVGVERGLDKRTSAALGVHSAHFAGERRTYAEGSIARTFGGFQGELAAAHEFGSGAVAQANLLGRRGKFNFGANALVTIGDFTSEFAGDELDYRLGFNFDTSLSLGRFVLPIQAEAVRSKLKTGAKVTELLMTTSVSAGKVALSAQLEHQEQTASASTSARSDTRLRLLANTRLKDLRLRGNATFDLGGDNSGLESATVTVDKTLDEYSDLNGEIEYMAQSDEARFSVGYSRRFDQLSLRGDAFVTSRGGVGANVSLAFSLGPDPVSGGVRFSETKLARTGQAAVTVFRDDNGNGRFDGDEEPLEDVLVEAGLRSTDAITAGNGRTIVDGLRPFRPVLVGVDEASLGDPYLAPAVKGIVVTPRPGVTAMVELPISPSGEIEGVLLNTAGLEQPGVLLELVDRGGNVVSNAVSEFDGFFLFERVPYGEYRLRVGADAARKLDVKSELRGALVVSREEDIVRAGPIKLVPAQPVIAAAGESAGL